MDIDYVVGPPHAEWMRSAPPQAAIIRMFGVTAAGARARARHSVCTRTLHARPGRGMRAFCVCVRAAAARD
jgi:hypothetical protein